MDDKNQIQKELNNMKLLAEGRMLEYQYVNELKNRKIDQLNREKSELEKEIKELKNEREKLIEQSNKKIEQMKNEIGMYEKSTSWKITKPLRNIADICRKLGGKNG